MWEQNYTPLADSLGWSALAAAFPIFTLLFLLGVRRKPAWLAAAAGLAVAILVAFFPYRMPGSMVFSSIAYGAAFGLFPIGWIVFSAILLYRITVESGKFEIVKDSIGSLTSDRRLQALLIAFAFGAFIEGAAGAGTPVAVAGAMLTGLGFSPFYAAGICLLANTAPVAFGAIGIPIITLSVTTGLPVDRLSSAVGRLCAPVSFTVPGYLIGLMFGWRGLKGVLPAVLTCGFSFAAVQLLASNLIGPQLTDILSSLSALLALVVLFHYWAPNDHAQWRGTDSGETTTACHSRAEVLRAWMPYVLLAVCVLLWGMRPVRALLEAASVSIRWPALHNLVERIPPVVSAATPYPAVYNFEWLAGAGTACFVAGILSTFFVDMGPSEYGRVVVKTFRQMLLPLVTIASVLGLAFLMNYCGATATLGLAFAATGTLFPYFSAMLGWLGVFLTGSDTSSNALFGNLQVITANSLGLNPVLTASANSSGGVMGKMISVQSIAVAVAATGLKTSDEGKLFRFTLRHSVLLASAMGLIAFLYAYLIPGWMP